jgi:hypothetical protein
MRVANFDKLDDDTKGRIVSGLVQAVFYGAFAIGMYVGARNTIRAIEEAAEVKAEDGTE